MPGPNQQNYLQSVLAGAGKDNRQQPWKNLAAVQEPAEEPKNELIPVNPACNVQSLLFD